MTSTMLLTLPILLADTDTDSAIKFVFGAIVVVIWIIGAIMSSLKKKGQQTPQQYVQQDWSHLLRDLTAGQNKPFNPAAPVPPHLQQQTPQQQLQTRQHMKQTAAFVQKSHYQQPQPVRQIKSFAQQSPRPFVQQYRKPQQTIQPPRPIQKKLKPQRRPPPPVPKTISVPRPPEAQVGLIQDSVVTMDQIGGATNVTSATRGGTGPLTRGQLRKLILWSEVLSPPLAIRE